MRRKGISYAHPLIVLVAHRAEASVQKSSFLNSPTQEGEPQKPPSFPTPLQESVLRIAVAAGKSVGTAVERNYAKRRMREAIRPLIPYMVTGWDVLLIARRPQQKASFQALQTALKTLLSRAKLLKPPK